MINKILMKGSLVICLFTITACGPQGEPDLSSSCTLNGNGLGKCEFMNSGTAEGSMCTSFSVEKFDTSQVEGEDDSLFRIGTGTGLILASTDSLCSGLVAPGDIREREKSLFFKDEAGRSLTPYEFCDTSSNYEDYWQFGLTPPENSWTDFCSIIIY
tara:strand:- start:51 stop:521 length:471 start_codon:yes stop_codon:yes gene_type:complete